MVDQIPERYKPKNLAQLVGNKKAVDSAKKHLPKHNVLLHGTTGVGKTSFAYAWAGTYNYTVVEINASDTRTKDFWEEFAIKTKQTSLFGKIVILLDEADGIQWFRHYKRIFRIIKECPHPVIVTANNDWEIKKYHDRWIKEESKRLGKKIPDLLARIKFYPPNINEVLARIKQINKENPELEINYTSIGTDIRNSILSSTSGGNKFIPEKDPFEVLTELFKYSKYDGVTKDHLLWICENIPKAYEGAELIKAYEILEMVNQSGNISIFRLFPKSSRLEKFEYPLVWSRASEISKRRKAR